MTYVKLIAVFRIKNPFSPGAEFSQPEFVGRDPILEQAK
jgi:hypothetical protein